jgi:LytR cell envelope-related transcriptional attenuator
VEHVQPLNRSSSLRAGALAVALLVALALAVAGGVMLVHRQEAKRPAAARESVRKPQPAPPLRARSRISVLVLNGNGVAHVAGNTATRLLARGYRHAFPSNAPSLEYARSVVLFRPGWQREAKRLTRDAKIPTVAPLDGHITPPYTHVPLVLILGR